MPLRGIASRSPKVLPSCVAFGFSFGKCFLIALHLVFHLSQKCFCISASTREIILGTENGQMYEMAVDEVDKKEKYVKVLFELNELPEAITGLQVFLDCEFVHFFYF